MKHNQCEDLAKAIWYIQRKLLRLEKLDPTPSVLVAKGRNGSKVHSFSCAKVKP